MALFFLMIYRPFCLLRPPWTSSLSSNSHKAPPTHSRLICRVGRNRKSAPYMAICMWYVWKYRMYIVYTYKCVVLASPTHMGVCDLILILEMGVLFLFLKWECCSYSWNGSLVLILVTHKGVCDLILVTLFFFLIPCCALRPQWSTSKHCLLGASVLVPARKFTLTQPRCVLAAERVAETSCAHI